MKTTKITDESFCQLLLQSISCRKEACLFKNILLALKDVVRCLYYLKTVVNIIITQFLFHFAILARYMTLCPTNLHWCYWVRLIWCYRKPAAMAWAVSVWPLLLPGKHISHWALPNKPPKRCGAHAVHDTQHMSGSVMGSTSQFLPGETKACKKVMEMHWWGFDPRGPMLLYAGPNI